MLCPKCNNPVEESAHYCPSCGHKMQKTKFFWPIVLGCSIFLLATLAYFWWSEEGLSKTAQKQLTAIKEKNYNDAFYGITTQDFQNTNSFETFKEFIITSPILQNYTSITFGKQKIENNKGTIKAILENGSQKGAEILYNMRKEYGKWKIDGITLTEYQKGNDPTVGTATSLLISPVVAQLKALKNQDLAGAYENVTKDFQTKAPFDNFKSFVSKFPILTTFQNYDFKEHSSDHGKGIVTVILNPEKEAQPLEYSLVQDEGKWKIQFMRITSPTKIETIGGKNDAQTMISAVQNYLEALKDNDIEGAYQKYLSSNIKKETSLQAFKIFVLGNPILTTYKALNIKEPYLEKGMGEVLVDLELEIGKSEVEFALEEEEGEWKIVGMHITKLSSEGAIVKETESKNFKTRDLIDSIQNFLTAIRTKESAKAYTQMTAAHFQEENTIKDFDEFLQKHSELAQATSASFEKLMFNNNIATFAVVLILTDKKVVPAEFDLIQEDDKWKILNIIVYPTKELPSETKKEKGEIEPIEFTKAILGTEVNDDGEIANPTTTFKPNTKDIYVNLYVHNGVAGRKFELVMRHVESGSNIPPVHASVIEEGDSVLSFVFSPPPKGWPSGNYQIKASSDSNVFKTFMFKVE